VEADSHTRLVMYAHLAEVLRSKGYDAIRYENTIEGGGSSWVNLSANQVVIEHVQSFTVGSKEFLPANGEIVAALAI